MSDPRVIELPSGREIRVNLGILGIGHEAYGEPLSVYEGFDGELPSDLSREDRRALGLIAIGRWTKWAEQE